MKLLSKFFSTKRERDLKALRPYVEEINRFEKKVGGWNQAAFQQRIQTLKEEAQGGKSLSKMLAEVFALVREAAWRVLKLRHFDVQLIGGVVLFQGKIAEMKTGEGKTLVATLTATLRALRGKGVHVVTVNDHLAKRDAEWMKPIYEYLGLSVGYVVNGLTHEERQAAYAKDITYGTNNEFGFDYLRDNMAADQTEQSQRGHYFCIIDEVDSILIDEARTPLIISGPSESNTEKYYRINKLIPRLSEAKRDEAGQELANSGDYIIELKDRNVLITEAGVKKLERLLGVANLYQVENTEILHHVSQALKAHKLFKRNVDYIVENGKVVIIDEFTGRKMEGRRFSDGLHQAIEAKENVNILSENQTIATITLQNYFRMYEVCSGMTGTADTEAEEFKKIYDLEVVVIPPNRPITRKDNIDKIYRTEKEKFNAIVKKAQAAHRTGQPILIGTASIEKSDRLHQLLMRNGLQHELLNAKHHEREAQIVAKAGQRGAITIATNMAGRGTDIKLGTGVKEQGGLLIIGSERHEARRIDNQLRGRAGRQGDPGESVFYLSLEDDLLKRFNSQKLSGIMLKLGMKEGEEIAHPLLSKQIEIAQKKVEGRNFEIRKHLLEYDDVMNVQRNYIYKERNSFLKKTELLEEITDYLEETINNVLLHFSDGKEKNDLEVSKQLSHFTQNVLGVTLPNPPAELAKLSYDALEDQLKAALLKSYHEKRAEHPRELLQQVERFVLLRALDGKWKEHLLQMDHLREGINLRAYGERKPLVEFKREGFRLFKETLTALRQETIELLFRIKLSPPPTPQRVNPSRQQLSSRRELFGTAPAVAGQAATLTQSQVRRGNKLGRNEPCYCGSGKKYKNCCLQ